MALLTIGDQFPAYELTALIGGDLSTVDAQQPGDYFTTITSEARMTPRRRSRPGAGSAGPFVQSSAITRGTRRMWATAWMAIIGNQISTLMPCTNGAGSRVRSQM